MPESRIDASRDGRWGVRQFFKGQPTGGGTMNCGWATEQEARKQNPDYEGFGGTHTYEPFDRFPGRHEAPHSGRPT